MVSFDNYAFFYFKNSILQLIISIIFIAYSIFVIKIISINYNKKSNSEKIILSLLKICYKILTVFMLIFEFLLAHNDSYVQTPLMNLFSRLVYFIFICVIILTFLLDSSGAKSVFGICLFFTYWFGSNYFRFAFFILICPFFFFYFKQTNSINSRIKFSSSVVLFILQSCFIFHQLK